MLKVAAVPPWYYCFYFGTIWSFFILALIIIGFLVFYLLRKNRYVHKKLFVTKWCSLGLALFFLTGYSLYYLLLMI